MARLGNDYSSMYGHTTEMARVRKEGIEKDGGDAHLRLLVGHRHEVSGVQL